METETLLNHLSSFSLDNYTVKQAVATSPGGSAQIDKSFWLSHKESDLLIGILDNGTLIISDSSGVGHLLSRYYELRDVQDDISTFDNILMALGNQRTLAPLDAIVLLQHAVSVPADPIPDDGIEPIPTPD